MTKIIISIALMLTVHLGILAQEFQGMAIYESKTSAADIKARLADNKNITPEMKKNIEDRMSKMLEKKFILYFDKSASIYKEEEKLDAPTQGGGGGYRMMGTMMGVGGTFYKNTKDKTYTVDKEFMGKEFLIKDTLPKLTWKMEAETRVIGGFNCFKATAIKPVSKSDFKYATPKKENQSESKPKEGDKKTDFMSQLDMPKEIIITAWYTPEVPVSQGPENYWGLPGLILEVNDGKTVMLCSKIVLNPKVKTEIKAPTKGKVVTQTEFDDIMVKKMEEFREMRSRSGNAGGPPRP